MKVTIEATSQLTEIQTETGKVPGRVWVGTTESGIPVVCVITRIAVPNSAGPEAHAAFELELGKPLPPPRPIGTEAIPLRMLL